MESLNSTNLTGLDFSEFANVYIGSGVVHLLLVVIPALVLGPLILSVLVSNKKLRDPTSILFMCITVVCTLGPMSYGLLTDISLITDYPVLGSCETLRALPFWFSIFFFQILLLTSNALVVAVQYVSVRWHQKLSTGKMVSIFLALLSFVFLVSLVNLLALLDTSAPVVTTRGYICYSLTSPFSFTLFVAAGVLGLTLFVIPSCITVVLFSVLLVKYVKKHTIDSSNKKVVRDVLIIMVAMTTSLIIFRLLPAISFLLRPALGSEEAAAVVSWVIDYSSELSYPLFLLLTLFVHKTVRTTFLKPLKCSNVKRMFGKRSNAINPSSDNNSGSASTAHTVQ